MPLSRSRKAFVGRLGLAFLALTPSSSGSEVAVPFPEKEILLESSLEISLEKSLEKSVGVEKESAPPTGNSSSASPSHVAFFKDKPDSHPSSHPSDPPSDPAPNATASSSSSSSSAPALGPLLPILSSSAQIASLAPLRHVTDLQLRLKNDPSPSAVRTELAAAADACAAHAVRLWVNDHWEAALDLRAASPAAAPFGVHLGQEDLCACAEQGGLARLREAGLALGASTHSYAELAVALGAGVSYVSLGPVHGTKSKEVGFAAQGMETVRKWRELMPEEVPLVVIGGIDGEERARECREAGAECVAVIGAVTKATDVQGAVDKLAAAMID
uniref:Thiamine phosphate synthase/TenI domain-containing protein n=1 Tax=Corethron hystrix TaxID=216773 RepID=A0A7S1BP00_9STRA|mmetsp:Transcript_33873/g.78216  ORF Transcript_33873/g.78216 Transcript_33873/m.78216 type:complete len:330 (+) Transcript_33873:119-1108(+)